MDALESDATTREQRVRTFERIGIERERVTELREAQADKREQLLDRREGDVDERERAEAA
jgi:hypothetical protein